MANATEKGNHNTFKGRFCSAELAAEMHLQLICLSVINIFLSVTSILANTMILVALQRQSSLHRTTKLLFRSLAMSDLFIGLFSEPSAVIYWISLVYQRWDICSYALISSFIMGFTLCSVSLLTLTAISVDRLLALLLKLRYRQVVTLKRIYITVTFFWVVSILSTTTYFWNFLIAYWYRFIGAFLCLLVSTVSHGKIFLSLRKQNCQVQIQGQGSQARQFSMAWHRKAVSTALWLQLALIVFYLPYTATEALTSQKGLSASLYVAREFMATLMFSNSSLNPILYCWKIREVRLAVKNKIRHFCCSSN